MYIQWKESLELHNDLIDTQHRIIVLLCRKLDIAIKTQESEQTVRCVMLELKKFVEFHFLSEENLMHEIGYPEVDNHALIHTDLLQQLDMMLTKISRHREFPEDLLYFLNNWVVDHLVKEDLKIANFIKHTGREPIGKHLYAEYLHIKQGSD